MPLEKGIKNPILIQSRKLLFLGQGQTYWEMPFPEVQAKQAGMREKQTATSSIVSYNNSYNVKEKLEI